MKTYLSCKRYVHFVLVVLLISACNNLSSIFKFEKPSPVSNKKEIKDGLIKTYRSNGSLYSEINYVKGVKHGISKSYAKSGKLQFVIPYDSGRKHGVSKLYYEDGKVRRETEYKNGKKNGIRKSYWTTGVISSSISYKDDMPGSDLKEFMKSGEEKSKYETLQVQAIDNLKTTGEYILKVKFSRNSKRAEYFIGHLEGGYLNEFKLNKIPIENGVGVMRFSPPPGAFVMEKLNIIGKLKTARGNPLIRQKQFNLAIEGIF